MSARAESSPDGGHDEPRGPTDPRKSSTSAEAQIPLKDHTPQDVTDLPQEEGATASSDSPNGDIEDVIPNGGYGWVNVGCVVLQNSVTWGEFLWHFTNTDTD
jgi:hypothetical protein